MGIPHEDEIPVVINNGVISIGKQEVVLDQEYGKHLLDNAFNNEVLLAIKPEYISIEEIPNSLKISAKLEFVEQKTDYQAVYFSISGINGYFAVKFKNDEKVALGKEIDLYFPYLKLNVYDKEHNKLNSREVVYPNKGHATVSVANGQMKVNVAGATLTYPEDPNIPAGEYEITFKQDKLLTIYNKNMIKAGHTNPEVEDINNVIKVSAYDEDVLGSKLLVYVAVNGLENYASFVVKKLISI